MHKAYVVAVLSTGPHVKCADPTVTLAPTASTCTAAEGKTFACPAGQEVKPAGTQCLLPDDCTASACCDPIPPGCTLPLNLGLYFVPNTWSPCQPGMVLAPGTDCKVMCGPGTILNGVTSTYSCSATGELSFPTLTCTKCMSCVLLLQNICASRGGEGGGGSCRQYSFVFLGQSGTFTCTPSSDHLHHRTRPRILYLPERSTGHDDSELCAAGPLH